jgi:hypothetical protein
MTGNVNLLPGDSKDGWLRNCANAVPNFASDCIGSASLVSTPTASRLPAKDLSYPAAKVRYISTVA